MHAGKLLMLLALLKTGKHTMTFCNRFDCQLNTIHICGLEPPHHNGNQSHAVPVPPQDGKPLGFYIPYPNVNTHITSAFSPRRSVQDQNILHVADTLSAVHPHPD